MAADLRWNHQTFGTHLHIWIFEKVVWVQFHGFLRLLGLPGGSSKIITRGGQDSIEGGPSDTPGLSPEDAGADVSTVK